jgi:hypothetical protein
MAVSIAREARGVSAEPNKIILYDHKEKSTCKVCKIGVKMHTKRMDVDYCSGDAGSKIGYSIRISPHVM